MDILKKILSGTFIKAQSAFKKGLFKFRQWFLSPVLLRLDQHEGMMKVLVDDCFRSKAIMRTALHKPIHVLFVSHEPTLWSMFESVYTAMEIDPDFLPVVVALPYRHATLPEGQYMDAGIFEFCKQRKIKIIQGYDKEKNEWLNPASLMPDYVFFQTPYHLFPPMWSVEQISMMARVCYIPYGSSVAKGDIAAAVHPEGFFKYISLFFIENSMKRALFEKRFKGRNWFKKENIVVSGYPKLDYLKEIKEYSGKAWKRGLQENIKRILWTPRFLTLEGTCHFFDYKDFFFDYCKNHPEVDFVFRPHPLCFQNFIKTGELPLDGQNKMRQEYDLSLNMAIDENSSYEDTFMTSDILISDYSSMMIEYFLTGKPIIYTHRKNEFNEYALALSQGMYWVNDIKELDETISMLLSGKDPLLKKREELMNKLYYLPEQGAGNVIKEYIASDYFQLQATGEFGIDKENSRYS